MDKNKIIVVGLLTLFLTFTVSAQSGLGDPLSGISQELTSTIGWYDGGGGASFILWIILPFVGMYAIFRFLFIASFNFAEENFSENTGTDWGSSSSGETSELAKNSAKILAISTSTISLVYFGDLLGWLMLVAGAGGLIFYVWSIASGLAGTTSPIPFGSPGIMSGNSGGNSSNNSNQVNEELQNAVGQLAEELDTTQKEMKDIKDKLDQDEAHMGEDESPEEAEQHIEEELHEIETVEKQFKNFEQQVGKIEKKLEDEEEYLIKDEKESEELIQKIEANQEKLESALSSMESDVEAIFEEEKQIENVLEKYSPQNAEKKLDDSNLTLEEFENYITEVDRFLKQIKELEGEEFEELKRELEDIKEVIEYTNEIKPLLKELNEELHSFKQELDVFKSVESEEEDIEEKAEAMARQYEHSETLQKLNREEQETGEIKNRLKKLLDRDKNMNNQLEQLEKEFKEIEQHKNDILSELKKLDQQMDRTVHYMKQIYSEIKEFEKEDGNRMKKIIEEVDGGSVPMKGTDKSNRWIESWKLLKSKMSDWKVVMAEPNNNADGWPELEGKTAVIQLMGDMKQEVDDTLKVAEKTKN